MKFSAAAVALFAAVGVSASAKGNVTYVTEVVDTYVTYCPGPTEIAVGGTTYTITEATTLTITSCGCTVTKPVIQTSSVSCHTCGGYNSTTLVSASTKPSNPGATQSSATTGGVPASTPTTKSPETVPTAGAGKLAAFSGAGLAGLVGLAAFAL